MQTMRRLLLVLIWLALEASLTLGAGRWRDNNYINEDGILPWAQCPNSPFLTGSFSMLNKEQQIVVALGASVWGTTDIAGRPLGSVKTITTLLYTQKPNEPCPWFFHCLQDGAVASQLAITGQMMYKQEKDRIVPLSESSFGLISIASSSIYVTFKFTDDSFLNGAQRAEDLPDRWLLDIKIADRDEAPENIFSRLFDWHQRRAKKSFTVEIPMCYQHVAAAVPLAVCTNILWGDNYLRHQSFSPQAHLKPGEDHLLRDFLIYYTVVHKVPVHISEARHVLKQRLGEFKHIYHRDLSSEQMPMITYRGGWNEDLEPRGFIRNADEEDGDECIAHEFLAENFCTWQQRLSTKWVLLLNIDHFTISYHHYELLSDVFRMLRLSSAALIIPHQRAHSPPQSSRLSKSVYSALDRFSLTGPEWQDKEARATPVQNPRKCNVNRIHDIELATASSTSYLDTSRAYGFNTIHLMGWSREDLNRPTEATENPTIAYWAKQIDAVLQDALNHMRTR